ncbi:MAG: DegV family protein [Lachnospiraceae bacterium]|nr:DegV family protein [Lachnospiraceae bacterium]
MSYKIILDSCGELPQDLKTDPHFERVPLELHVGDYRTWDDDTFDQADFLRRVAECPTCPKSACPSPERYMKAYDCGAQDIYVVTLSGNLSGSFNSANVGKDMFLENNPDKNVFVCDSCSASVGQTQIALFIHKLAQKGLLFDEITEKAKAFRDDLDTYFILDNLETLRKNGRLSKVKAFVASTLSIKPVMGATDDGNIIQRGQAIGMKKAMQKMVDLIAREKPDSENRTVMISHCNCRERAEIFRDVLLSKMKCKDLIMLDTAGISSMYANDGGFIVTL